MKTFLLGILLLSSSLAHSAILSYPIISEYGSGYDERTYNAQLDWASYLFEADLGVEKIYGFQLYMELAPSSIFYGSSSLGFGVNRNYLFNGWLYNGITLNELSPKVMRYSMYKELEIEEQSYNKFAVGMAYNKREFSRFMLKNVTLFFSTDIHDRFYPDTANAPYLPPIGEPIYYHQISEPPTYMLYCLLFILCLRGCKKII
ncbi:hypothetical protein [Salinimonas lutimaris]|uniref:hypothetical protein n=1 Tax=Salinimonas lutimaris TaxID=914153 RepID=UPI0010C055D4|nr:hypothetical protein [Salinimonas lutimaris]